MWIDTQADLETVCEQLQPEELIAVDTEFAAERRYFPRFDLLQIGIPGSSFAIDVHASLDFTPLWSILTDPTRVLLLHAAEQDLLILTRWMKRPPSRIFDTQLAAALLGHGPRIGYGPLVEEILDQKLDKSKAMSDWSRRPLSAAQIEYALDDVRYLHRLHAHLLDQLNEKGRLGWLEEECTRLLTPTQLRPPEPSQRWRTLFGRARLDARQRAILQEVVAWREERAARKNQPPRMILPDDLLLQIARHPPRSLNELRQFRQVFERTIKTCGQQILAAVARGLERPEEALKQFEPGSPTELPAGLGAMLEACAAILCQRVDVALPVVTSRSELEQLAAYVLAGREPVDIRLLTGWRRSLVGEGVLSVLRGEQALVVAPSKGQLVLEQTAASLGATMTE